MSEAAADSGADHPDAPVPPADRSPAEPDPRSTARGPEPARAPDPVPADPVPADRGGRLPGPRAAGRAPAEDYDVPGERAEPPAAPDPVSGGSTLAELDLKPTLEAILMVVDQPATVNHLAKVLDRPRREVADALQELADEYATQRRGFDLRLVAGGWRFYTRPEYADAVEAFVLDGQQARLTQAALETLAVVAYRQPVTRSRVSAVRGVNCDGVMRTLLQRGLLEEAGSEPETGAILYVTTHYFLERMGLRGLDELPELAPFLPEADAVEGESQEGVPSFDPDAEDSDTDDSSHLHHSQTEH